jgi:dsDNA-specific endonuclease/ATPase MutS2
VAGDDESDESEDEAPVEIPIDGTLDLHTFRPSDVGDLLSDYLEACREKGILQVRIVHGKGTGSLRRSVHAVLERLEEVESFALAGMGGGGWGATLVQLRPDSSPDSSPDSARGQEDG